MSELQPMTDAIVKMIADAYAFSKTLLNTGQHAAHLSHHHIVEEFKTVRINLPRRTGHTSAALALYKKYPNTVMMFPTHHILQHFIHMGEFSRQEHQAFMGYRSLVVPEDNGRIDIKYELLRLQNAQRGMQLPRPMFILDPAGMVGIGVRRQIIPAIAARWDEIKLYIELE